MGALGQLGEFGLWYEDFVIFGFDPHIHIIDDEELRVLLRNGEMLLSIITWMSEISSELQLQLCVYAHTHLFVQCQVCPPSSSMISPSSDCDMQFPSPSLPLFLSSGDGRSLRLSRCLPNMPSPFLLPPPSSLLLFLHCTCMSLFALIRVQKGSQLSPALQCETGGLKCCLLGGENESWLLDGPRTPAGASGGAERVKQGSSWVLIWMKPAALPQSLQTGVSSFKTILECC